MPVTLSEALSLLESGQTVSLRYITANTSRGAGGKVVELARCKIARRQTGPEETTGNKTATASKKDYSEGKNPNHRQHFTRNIELPSTQIRTVYPILITHINGQSVL